jgi:hypothetical protein
MSKPNYYKLIFIAILFAGCDTKPDLELSLLTNEVVCVEDFDFDYAENKIDYDKDKIYDSISRNIIKLKLENNSSKKYFLVLNENFVGEIENNGMPKPSGFNIADYNKYSFNLYKDDKILDGNFAPMGKFPQHGNDWNSWVDRQFYIDSLYVSETQKRGIYRKGKFAGVMTRDVLNNSFVIYPGEVKYITSVVNLPYRKKEVSWLSAIDKLKPNLASVTIINNSDYTEKLLSEDQKKEIHENEYTLFNGVIESNKIPVKLITMSKKN